MKKLLAVARRELVAYFVSPVSYLIVTLFLLVQGYSFWLFLSILNSRPAKYRSDDARWDHRPGPQELVPDFTVPQREPVHRVSTRR